MAAMLVSKRGATRFGFSSLAARVFSSNSSGSSLFHAQIRDQDDDRAINDNRKKVMEPFNLRPGLSGILNDTFGFMHKPQSVSQILKPMSHCITNKMMISDLRDRIRTYSTAAGTNEVASLNRPLSPHLSVYAPQLNSTTSIFHRISGAFLAVMILFPAFFTTQVGTISMTYPEFYQLSFHLPKLFFSLAPLGGLCFAYHMFFGLYRMFGIKF